MKFHIKENYLPSFKDYTATFPDLPHYEIEVSFSVKDSEWLWASVSLANNRTLAENKQTEAIKTVNVTREQNLKLKEELSRSISYHLRYMLMKEFGSSAVVIAREIHREVLGRHYPELFDLEGATKEDREKLRRMTQ